VFFARQSQPHSKDTRPFGRLVGENAHRCEKDLLKRKYRDTQYVGHYDILK